MTIVQQFVDAEGVVKAWAADVDDIAALVGPKVFLVVNSNTVDQLVVTRVGGTADPSEAPLDRPLIQFDCWATSNKKAAALAYRVMGACRDMTAGTPMGVDAVGMGTRVTSGPRPLRDEADQLAGRHRYTLTVEFVVRAATTGS